MTGTSQPMSPLRLRMIEDMTVRIVSPATQRPYLHAVAKFSRWNKIGEILSAITPRDCASFFAAAGCEPI